MNKQTKIILGLAILAGAGYLLYNSKKDKDASSTVNFANFAAPEDGEYVTQCNGHTSTFTSKTGNKYYRCCKKGYYSDTSLGKPCGNIASQGIE